MHMAEHGHGHSLAAWTGVGVILLGSAVVSVAAVIPSMVVAIIGIVLCVLGLVAGRVLSMAGYGQRKPDRPKGTTAIR